MAGKSLSQYRWSSLPEKYPCRIAFVQKLQRVGVVKVVSRSRLLKNVSLDTLRQSGFCMDGERDS